MMDEFPRPSVVSSGGLPAISFERLTPTASALRRKRTRDGCGCRRNQPWRFEVKCKTQSRTVIEAVGDFNRFVQLMIVGSVRHQ